MRELKQQLVNAVLVTVTLAAMIAAGINFQQQGKFHLPDDGVTWVDKPWVDGPPGASKTATSAASTPQDAPDRSAGNRERPVAIYVIPGSPGEKAGIHVGDALVSIDGLAIDRAIEATEVLARLGSWRKADYKILHGNVEVPANVIVGEADRDSTIYYQYAVGVLYLAIGLFVYFRRVNAPHALHFYLLCLASFVFSTFHYSGKLNNFDKVIYLGNVVSGFLAPTLFLHFCFVFPEPRKWIRRRGAATLVYLPGLVLATVQIGFIFGWIETQAPLIEVRWLLDRVWLGFLCSLYAAGGLVLAAQMRNENDPVVRRQLTWLRNGALAGILPFALFYAVPYVFGVAPNHAMSLAVLSLPLIPLTWAYAILRYRLMDVDVIFQEGYVYTLATLAVLAIFYGMIFSVSRAGELNGPAMVAMMLIAAFVFQPIRKWIQEQLDRYYFYKDRYDYRRTLIEFARELGSPTDLDLMMEMVADRLIRTLGIRHAAFFVWDEHEGRFQIQLASNRGGRQTENVPYGLDLSFLRPEPGKPYLFFERTRNQLDVISNHWPAGVRRSIAELDLTYYLPCSARGRTIAYLGVSRNENGDFLSSEDVELLVTLSSYLGIAIDNAVLYRSLELKASEYERLKDFSENIVESLNVGIVAADLEGRVESWNSQIEKLTGILRQDAVGRHLRELFPADLCEQLEPGLADAGVHSIYKYVLQPRETNGHGARATATLNIAVAPLLNRETARGSSAYAGLVQKGSTHEGPARAGEHVGRLIIFDDVTDRAEMERRLVQADKLSSIGLLAAGVAHEVNTPLAVISTYAQMLAKQISGDAEKAPLLEKIARQTFRASEIVNSLLNFSRTSPTEFAIVDVNKILRETMTLIEHQLTKTGIRVELDLNPALPRIRGNPGKLQQVFLNLFLNARDAMETGGLLTVHSADGAGQVRISVTDTGSGITPENLPRIFDPFFTTKGARKGTGLGLSVSYGIVKEHGGEIEVESHPVSQLGEDLGQTQPSGTRFVLRFPEAKSAFVVAPIALAPFAPVKRDSPRTELPAAHIPVESPVGPGVNVGTSPYVTPAAVPAQVSAAAVSAAISGPIATQSDGLIQ